jgi:hypothetical protein
MSEQTESPAARSRSDRIVGSIFGVFFVVLAIVIMVLSNESDFIGSLAVSLIVGGLGVDSLVSAARNQRSLVSRIGPLP